MLSLTIKDTKNFMSQLLIKEAFDGLFLSEAVIKTANSYCLQKFEAKMHDGTNAVADYSSKFTVIDG